MGLKPPAGASKFCLSLAVAILSVGALYLVLRLNEAALQIIVQIYSGDSYVLKPAGSDKPFMAASVRLLSADFEVFGKVQGVFFRKHTKKTADINGIRGWVMNTPRGSVVGTIQGTSTKLDVMKRWLRTTGSPKSRIDQCVFKNERSIDRMEFSSFEIRH